MLLTKYFYLQPLTELYCVFLATDHTTSGLRWWHAKLRRVPRGRLAISALCRWVRLEALRGLLIFLFVSFLTSLPCQCEVKVDHCFITDNDLTKGSGCTVYLQVKKKKLYLHLNDWFFKNVYFLWLGMDSILLRHPLVDHCEKILILTKVFFPPSRIFGEPDDTIFRSGREDRPACPSNYAHGAGLMDTPPSPLHKPIIFLAAPMSLLHSNEVTKKKVLVFLFFF